MAISVPNNSVNVSGLHSFIFFVGSYCFKIWTLPCGCGLITDKGICAAEAHQCLHLVGHWCPEPGFSPLTCTANEPIGIREAIVLPCHREGWWLLCWDTESTWHTSVPCLAFTCRNVFLKRNWREKAKHFIYLHRGPKQLHLCFSNRLVIVGLFLLLLFLESWLETLS